VGIHPAEIKYVEYPVLHHPTLVISEMENKRKWNESGIQKTGKRFAYPFTGFLDEKRCPPRGLSSSTTASPLKRTNAAFFINWKGDGGRLGIGMVPDDSRLLKIQKSKRSRRWPAGWTPG
jgi:hypothetical protein